jgi:predicted transcriptional regulator
MMEPLEVYQRISKIIHSIYTSRLKLQILLSLSGGVKTLSTLREVTGSTSQALIPKIRGLEKLSLVEPIEHGYTLTPLGKIVTARIEDFIVTLGSIYQQKEFWSTHDIEGIPRSFLGEIGDLLESELKFDTTTDILHVYSDYVKMLKEATFIKGISSVMSPGLAEALTERVIAGIPVDLILNASVLDILKQEPYLSQIQKLLEFPNFRIWVTDDLLRIGITVTDKHLSLGLNRIDGKMYDSSTDLNSDNPKAIEWGQRLFQYFQERSRILKL